MDGKRLQILFHVCMIVCVQDFVLTLFLKIAGLRDGPPISGDGLVEELEIREVKSSHGAVNGQELVWI